eukprot:4235791-Amphidinium_carterae.1
MEGPVNLALAAGRSIMMQSVDNGGATGGAPVLPSGSSPASKRTRMHFRCSSFPIRSSAASSPADRSSK